MSPEAHATAFDVEQSIIYYPEVRPGYVGWANLYPFGNGDLGIAFQEIRRGPERPREPVSLEFVESAGFPYSFASAIMPWTTPDMVSEYVHMKSEDNGKTWTQTGRCPVRKRHLWYAGFPDGRLVRFSGAGAVSAEEGTGITVEESIDGGNTWKRIAFFLERHWSHMFKFRKLSDGRLVAAGGILPSWGANGMVPQALGHGARPDPPMRQRVFRLRRRRAFVERPALRFPGPDVERIRLHRTAGRRSALYRLDHPARPSGAADRAPHEHGVRQ